MIVLWVHLIVCCWLFSTTHTNADNKSVACVPVTTKKYGFQPSQPIETNIGQGLGFLPVCFLLFGW